MSIDQTSRTMSLTFVGAPLVPFRGQQRMRTLLNGRRFRAAADRRAFLPYTACLAASKEPGASEEEEVLDEAAMRAAEIHEVLMGLKDFKGRIIDDATSLAKKVRAPKKQLEAALKAHPDIIKIDSHIAELEEELKALGDR